MGVIDKIKAKLHSHGSHASKSTPAGSSSGTSTSNAASAAAPAAAAPADAPAAASSQAAEAPAQALGLKASSPEFDDKLVTVVFVLGGPGAGKGTQCERLVNDYGFVHLSAGDLLRAEQAREGSEYGQLIADYIKEGKIVPMEVTIALLQNAMRASLKTQGQEVLGGGKPVSEEHKSKWENGKGRFLVDGFPRKMDQAIGFDDTVCTSRFVLFLHCTEEVMLSRLLERGKTSGRADDNEESIKKRFRTFVDTSMPVVDYYREKGRVVEVDSIESADAVYAKIRTAMDESFARIDKAQAEAA